MFYYILTLSPNRTVLTCFLVKVPQDTHETHADEKGGESYEDHSDGV